MQSLKVKSTTTRTFKSHKNIDRRFLWWTVAKKLRGKVNRQKTLNIISFLMDILLEEIKNGTEIKIGNFCKIYLKQNKPRKYVSAKKVEYFIYPGLKYLILSIDKRLGKTLVSHLDCQETFKKLEKNE